MRNANRFSSIALRTLVKKALAIPIVLLFMNSLFIIFAPDVYAAPMSLVPIALLSAVICIDVAIRSVSAKPDRFQRAITGIAFLLYPFMVALPYFEFKYLTSPFLSGVMNVVVPVGVVILLLGSLILIASRLQIGRYGGTKIVIEENHHLVTSGMYRHTRNPQYLGFILIFLGYAVALGSLLIASMSVIGLFAVFRSRMILEEELLLTAFGDEYREYMERTWRLLPRIY